jgi:hypothetical protein
MGVDWFMCEECKDTVCDAGHYDDCYEDYGGCGRRYHDGCGDVTGEGYDETSEYSCMFCRGETVEVVWGWPEILGHNLSMAGHAIRAYRAGFSRTTLR